jgi:tRNA (guanine-N7-)-methyltransferase
MNDGLEFHRRKGNIRMRLRRKSGTKELLQTLEQRVVLQPKAYKGRWRDVFGNDKPIHAELGMGKGRFISLMSLQHPEYNFIGIDMYDELIRKGSEKADETRTEWAAVNGKEPPNNLRLALGNIEGIEEMFAPGELDRIYLNFSDPWPKTRHASRRLTHANFVNKYRDILSDDGEIHFKTDSRSLFEFSLNSFAEMELMMRNISLDLHGNGTVPNNVMTEYEMKFSSRGVNIHRVEVIVGERAVVRRREELETLKKKRAAAAAAEMEDDTAEDVELSTELGDMQEVVDARGRRAGSTMSVRGSK